MSKYNIAGVYKIQNKIDGKVYIGQSIDVLGRWREHIRDAWQVKPHSQIAWAIKRFGPEMFTFEILERFDSNLSPKYLRYKLKSTEEKYVEKFDSYCNGYNGDYGGNQGKIKPEKAF